jgi:N-acylneuraminate cytidylyltransferase/CMP-N,N'-diacetyllegionaminic acid synthase
MVSKYLAIIPARGGSKGLPKKNILNLAGKPLIAHTIEAAIKSKCFTNIVVSTDCQEIKKISLEWGAKVIDRPPELATDTASSLDVINHVLTIQEKNNELNECFMLLQPTSPCRNYEHIQQAINKYKLTNSNSLVSIMKSDHPIQKFVYKKKDGIEPVFSWEDLTKPRQDLEDTFGINGAIYISKSQDFIKNSNLFSSPLIGYEMDRNSSIDIDNEEDFYLAEYYINRKK